MTKSSATNTANRRSPFSLTYRIIITAGDSPLYGIAVGKRVGRRIIESAQTGPFTDNRATAAYIRKTLARNLVTPMSLCCIVDQLLDERR